MRTFSKPRGVTLIEGLMASVILLTGMVGVLQGIVVASTQNSIANRHTRASTIANELLSAVEAQRRDRLFAAGGLFAGCTALPLPAPLDVYKGTLDPMPTNLPTGFTGCYVNFDAAAAGFQTMTPGYTASDRTTYERVLIVYRNTTDPTKDDVAYVGLNVGWKDSAGVRVVQRFTALYNMTINQTNLEF